ncbi:hypothetical protein [Halalkalibacter oceani]|uniref:hypothetical protein n=1 Tax=Halalkalibacter oceani TaxID=1653776 RepID=UPI00339448E3
MNYFEAIASDLSNNEIMILGILMDHDSDAPFKALKRKDLKKKIDWSQATFNKTIMSLETKKLIGILRNQMTHDIYITNFGVKSVHYSLEGVE